MDRNRRWSIVAYALTIWSAAVCTGDRSGRLRTTRSAGVLLDPKCLSRALLTVVVNSAVTSIAPTATKAVSMRFRLGQGAGTCSQRHDSGLGCSSLHGFTSRKGSSRLQALSVCPRPMCQRRGWRLMSLRLTQRLRSHRVHATSQTSWTWRPWLAAVASCCLGFTLENRRPAYRPGHFFQRDFRFAFASSVYGCFRPTCDIHVYVTCGCESRTDLTRPGRSFECN